MVVSSDRLQDLEGWFTSTSIDPPHDGRHIELRVMGCIEKRGQQCTRAFRPVIYPSSAARPTLAGTHHGARNIERSVPLSSSSEGRPPNPLDSFRR
jgi:hypothetical protein